MSFPFECISIKNFPEFSAKGVLKYHVDGGENSNFEDFYHAIIMSLFNYSTCIGNQIPGNFPNSQLFLSPSSKKVTNS